MAPTASAHAASTAGASHERLSGTALASNKEPAGSKETAAGVTAADLPARLTASAHQTGAVRPRASRAATTVTTAHRSLVTGLYGGARYAGGYGGYSSGQSSPSFAGGYGAGSGESGSNRGEFSRAYGTTGEGRWGGQFSGAAGSSPFGGTFAGRGPRNYQRSDERIREDVNERLTADPRVDASEIDVRVVSGEVILTGSVDDRRTRRMVEECIEDLPGVRDVKNELRVSRSMFSGQDTSEPKRGREDGGLGHTGDPQKRTDVTTLNQTGKINR